MRQFYLYKNSWGFYMAVMIDPVSGLKRGAKSTHTKDKVEATVLAAEWAKGGMPEAKSHSRAFLCPDSSSVKKPASKKSDIKLCEFLINFWDYDKSDALQRSFAKGKKLSGMHTDAMKGLAKNHWLPYFGEDKLVEDLEPE